MNNIRIIFVIAFAMLVSGCGLFGGADDDGTGLTTAETFVPEPTANIVSAVPADDTAAAGDTTGTAAAAPLPTAVTIPPTAVPPVPTPDRSQPTSYVVQSGDVLGLIAERYDVDIAELRRVNDLSGNLIRVGQTLTIPAAAGAAVTSAEPADETASAPVGSTTAPAPAPDPTPVSCGSNAVGHCVQSGETLSGLASRYGTTIDAITSANPSITGNTIRIGALLTIPGQGTASTGTTTGSTSTGTTAGTVVDPAPTAVVPRTDADCKAINIEYPFFHAADGLCYANPIGGTASATDTAAETTTGSGAVTDPDELTCSDDFFLFEDPPGVFKCYPVPNQTPTVGPSPTSAPDPGEYYGLISDGCDSWEIEWPSRGDGECWPKAEATEAQIAEGRETRP